MSGYRTVEAGIPLGSVLGPHLFAVYTTDIPRQEETILGEYADDTAIEYPCESVEIATRRTQKALDGISDWSVKWKIVHELRQEPSPFGKKQKTQDCPYAAPKDQRKQHYINSSKNFFTLFPQVY